MSEWRTIDSAPDEGEVLICFRNKNILPALKKHWGWCFWNGAKMYGWEHITHWIPLPEPLTDDAP